MKPLPRAVYSVKQLRELEQRVTRELGIPPGGLMERAGAAALIALQRRWPKARRLTILVGRGNNGGDALVLARLAQEAGLHAYAFRVESGPLPDDAAGALSRWEGAGGVLRDLDDSLVATMESSDVIVDALFGIGLNRPIGERWQQVIEKINDSRTPTFSLDIPSGLDADRGIALPTAVHADMTITFLGLKLGLFTAEGPDYTGVIEFSDLEATERLEQPPIPLAERLRYEDWRDYLLPRRRSSHKGEFGHLLLIGGDHGMAGAIRLAGEAALRIGVGRVTIVTRAAHAAQIAAARPELMCLGIEQRHDLLALLQRVDTIAVGPGLGRGNWGKEMLAQVVDSGLPMVIDADGLQLLKTIYIKRNHWILTPHPGEAANLIGRTTDAVQEDRIGTLEEIQNSYGGICVLKGTGSLVHSDDGKIALCSAGNPGLATAGSGDVLTGVIGGLLAQGLSLTEAAQLGVLLHAMAGDLAAAEGERGLLASDLFPLLRTLANPKPELAPESSLGREVIQLGGE